MYEFLCECSNADCTFRLNMTLPEYEHVRQSGKRFSVKAGHAMSEVHRVVEQRDGYDIVEKIGEAGDLVERSDPR